MRKPNERIEPSYCGKSVRIKALANGWVISGEGYGEREYGYDNFTSVVNELYRLFGLHSRVGDVVELTLKEPE